VDHNGEKRKEEEEGLEKSQVKRKSKHRRAEVERG